MSFKTTNADEPPPQVGLIFMDEAAAISIFDGLRSLVGSVDTYDILRLSFIEDDRSGSEPGYWVSLGTGPEAVLRSVPEINSVTSPRLILESDFRIYRQDCPLPSANLERFRQSLAIHKAFDILPVIASNIPPRSADDLRLLEDHSIRKSLCLIRTYTSIPIDDPDRLTLP